MIAQTAEEGKAFAKSHGKKALVFAKEVKVKKFTPFRKSHAQKALVFSKEVAAKKLTLFEKKS